MKTHSCEIEFVFALMHADVAFENGTKRNSMQYFNNSWWNILLNKGCDALRDVTLQAT